MEMRNSRSEVFRAIDGERDYQDSRQGNAARPNIDDNRDLGSLITLIDVYVGKVKVGFAGPHPSGKSEALEQLRKVAALAVLALEIHGVTFRPTAVRNVA